MRSPIQTRGTPILGRQRGILNQVTSRFFERPGMVGIGVKEWLGEADSVATLASVMGYGVESRREGNVEERERRER